MLPVKVNVPVPAFAKTPPTLKPEPPSAIVPTATLLILFPPTVRVLDPRPKVPRPAIDPTVVPAEVRFEISKIPPALLTTVEVPPKLVSCISSFAPGFRVIEELAAVLFPKNKTALPFPPVMEAVPALLPLNSTSPPGRVLIIAFPTLPPEIKTVPQTGH